MLSPALPIQVILGLAWLTACVVCDLRTRQVPAPLTVIPLALAALWRLFQGGWTVVLLVTALIALSDIPQPTWRIILAGLATILMLILADRSGWTVPILVICGVWVLWETGAMGGADAKIIITLVLWFANGLLVIPILAAGGFQGLIGLFAGRKTIPYTVSILLGTVAWWWMTGCR